MAENHLEFLSLTGGCTGLSESTLVKMPHCWKSHKSQLISRQRAGVGISNGVRLIAYAQKPTSNVHAE